MAEYIDRESLKKVLTRYLYAEHVQMGHSVGQGMRIAIKSCIELLDNEYAADVAPVVHGRWMFEAHKEKVNCRWNVTAECSECCDQKKEVWAGFFTGVPDWLARDTALLYAKEVKLDNYCPNCGAKMDGE